MWHTTTTITKTPLIVTWFSSLKTDLLYSVIGTDETWLRLPRLIKVLAFWEFTERLDSILAKPYFLRIFKTVTYMLYLIHLEACSYYAISNWEGIGINNFTYNGEGIPYVRCFYFATKVSAKYILLVIMSYIVGPKCKYSKSVCWLFKDKEY